MINPDTIAIDTTFGPAGAYGFRKGLWTATYRGFRFEFFDSVSHAADLAAQKRQLQRTAVRVLLSGRAKAVQ